MDIIMEFAMKKPVFRILVNTPSTHGAVGASTGLAPALTLGCGTWGGSSTSDNVSPLQRMQSRGMASQRSHGSSVDCRVRALLFLFQDCALPASADWLVVLRLLPHPQGRQSSAPTAPARSTS